MSDDFDDIETDDEPKAKMTFAEVLEKQIVARKQTRRGARLLKIIREKPSRRRTRILNRLERHAKIQLSDLGLVGAEEITDWSTVGERDWSKFFDKLLEFLMKILPLILSLFML